MNNSNNDFILSKMSGSKWHSNVIDYIALFILGSVCYLYSIFGSDFAENSINLFFLDFPIFIGEIILIICLILFLVKLKFVFLQFPRFRYMLLVYCGFLLFKALYGYFNWGPLAFRHSAIFYYPFFAILGYYFYNESFFGNHKIRATLLIILIVTAYEIPGATLPFFLFIYWMLMLVLALGFKPGMIKNLLLAIVVLLIFSQFKIIYQVNRSCLIASLISIYTVSILILSILKLRSKSRIAVALLLLVFLITGVAIFSNKNAARSLIKIREIVEWYKKDALYVSQNEKTFRFAKIAPKIYHANQVKPANKKLAVTIKKIPDRNNIVPSPTASPGSENNIVKIGQGQVEKTDLVPRPQVKSDQKMPNLEVVDFKAMKSLLKKDLPRGRDFYDEIGNIVFRLLIWRDILVELIEEKPIFGFSFGKPLRSKSIEILNWGSSEWSRDGWITPHNSYLSIIYYSGIVGLALIAILFCIFIKMLGIFLVHKSFIGIILSGALLYWLVIANFMVILEFPYWSIPFWALFGITFRISNNLIHK
ncbi:MAG: O-antigen ligase family protein [Candidatus Omnitrophica bacterium]|nr:O-antigen ligase family protein [Candidatus Omnitrophota bacterium]